MEPRSDDPCRRIDEDTVHEALKVTLGGDGAQNLLSCMAAAEPPVALVGGWLRDLLLGQASADVDLVAACPDDLAEALVAGGARKKVLLDSERRTWRIVFADKQYVDISALQGALAGSLLADLQRRDLRVNAIAWTPNEGLLDPLGGVSDLRCGILQAAGATAMRDDPLRGLRVWRLALQVGLQPSSELLSDLDGLRLDEISPERICSELRQILLHPEAPRALEGLASTGILEQVLPAGTRTTLLKECMSRQWQGTSLQRCRDAAAGETDQLALRLGWLLESPDLKRELTERRWPRRVCRLAAAVSREVALGSSPRLGKEAIVQDLRRWRDYAAVALLGRVAQMPDTEADALVEGYLAVADEATR